MAHIAQACLMRLPRLLLAYPLGILGLMCGFIATLFYRTGKLLVGLADWCEREEIHGAPASNRS